MATGYYDANGIWQYGESDPIALFSDLLNLGQDSTSDQFTNDRARISFLEQSVEQASTFVASSSAARDSYWGVPGTSAAQLALQNKGARTVRTDLGYTEQYFAAYNVSTNPGGRAEGAGWTPIRRKDGLVPVVPTSVVVATGSSTATPIGQIAFTGATALSLNGVFGSEYKHYKVELVAGGSAGASIELGFKYRAAGTDLSSAYYYNGTLTGTTIIKWGGTNTTSVPFARTSELGTRLISTIELATPGIAGDYKTFRSDSYGWWQTDGAGVKINIGSNNYNNGAYDGFTITPSTGNISGTIQVFGFND